MAAEENMQHALSVWKEHMWHVLGLAFDGPAFRGFAAKTFSKADEKQAQASVRILPSPRYRKRFDLIYCVCKPSAQVLKPYDLIRPYRLEMTSKLRGKTMYDVWGDTITDALAKELKLSKAKFLVNCVQVVSCEFSGPSSLVKQARGAMCKYIVQKRIKNPADLKKFTGDAKNRFAFNAAKSSNSKLVFTRGGGSWKLDQFWCACCHGPEAAPSFEGFVSKSMDQPIFTELCQGQRLSRSHALTSSRLRQVLSNASVG
ncbi:hypothetical protein AK812_SmicGene38651 [Symbiodinium microadriaticum]|uniref:Uncharacterized protein n=1 Tax=Symbiodinium microadriaticum TaxID=2951 RepID=A0A1Q9CD84_SYMMI|nr:hypothetical protein AK812_SmicGene38651 [Symbiodinium microadriaticum]CAE7759121.1 unnamed protein product [Symbiodinium microadriaticum]CAE7945900.1 unnamed protein product [Symbiodinium sp. KB8]